MRIKSMDAARCVHKEISVLWAILTDAPVYILQSIPVLDKF